MITIVKVSSVEPVGDFRLRIGFSDGLAGIRDLSDILAEPGWMLQPLRDPEFFKRVFISFGVLTWPNGYDLDSIALHDEMSRAGLLVRTEAA